MIVSLYSSSCGLVVLAVSLVGLVGGRFPLPLSIPATFTGVVVGVTTAAVSRRDRLAVFAMRSCSGTVGCRRSIVSLRFGCRCCEHARCLLMWIMLTRMSLSG